MEKKHAFRTKKTDPTPHFKLSTPTFPSGLNNEGLMMSVIKRSRDDTESREKWLSVRREAGSRLKPYEIEKSACFSLNSDPYQLFSTVDPADYFCFQHFVRSIWDEIWIHESDVADDLVNRIWSDRKAVRWDEPYDNIARYSVLAIPSLDDGDLLGRVLIEATEVDRLINYLRRQDTRFAEKVFRLEVGESLAIARSLANFISLLTRGHGTYVLDWQNTRFLDQFCILVGLGFFVWKKNHYEVVVPGRIDRWQVKRVVRDYRATQDKRHFLHPEDLVNSVPAREAYSIWTEIR